MEKIHKVEGYKGDWETVTFPLRKESVNECVCTNAKYLSNKEDQSVSRPERKVILVMLW